MPESSDQTSANQPAKLTRLTAENAQLRQQLNQAQRSSALGELVSTTTHEFNNVLMTVLNYAKMGLRHEDPATRVKAFEKILKAGERAAKITNSVLGMARNRSEQFDATNVENLVDETMVLMERELMKYRISCEIVAEPNLPEIHAIGNQIQQVFLNLLINSRQAMPDGGQVVIRLKHDSAMGCVDLSVRDYGTGIAPDKLRKIFDPYFTTKSGPDESGKGGTGLGLAACRSIIEAHGGKIRVESTVGKGTCFTLKLPVSKAAIPTMYAAGATTTTPAQR